MPSAYPFAPGRDSNRERAAVDLVAVDHDEALIGLAARTDEDRQGWFVVRAGLDHRTAHLASIPAQAQLLHGASDRERATVQFATRQGDDPEVRLSARRDERREGSVTPRPELDGITTDGAVIDGFSERSEYLHGLPFMRAKSQGPGRSRVSLDSTPGC